MDGTPFHWQSSVLNPILPERSFAFVAKFFRLNSITGVAHKCGRPFLRSRLSHNHNHEVAHHAHLFSQSDPKLNCMDKHPYALREEIAREVPHI